MKKDSTEINYIYLHGKTYMSLISLAKICNREYSLFYTYSKKEESDPYYIKTEKFGKRSYVEKSEYKRIINLYSKENGDKKRLIINK